MNLLNRAKMDAADRWLSIKIKRVVMVAFVLLVYKNKHNLSAGETSQLFIKLSEDLQLGYDSKSLVFLFWLVRFLKLESLYCKDGKIRFNALKRKCLLAYDSDLMDHDMSVLSSLSMK